MRTVLITGASSGFGLAASILLAQRNWRVIATMRSLDKQSALVDAARAAGVAGSIVVEQLDVTDAALPARMAEIIAAVGGRIDAVVNNAGLAVVGAFEDVPPADLRRVMDTNFYGALDVTRALLPTFRAQRKGRIVFVSSDSGFAGEPTNAIYCASKFAIEGFAESLAFEVAPFGIDVALVEPGPFRTEIWQSLQRVRPPGTPYAALLDKVWPSLDAFIAKNAGDPQDVARAIATVLDATRPRFRTPVGATARWSLFVRGKVPSSVIRRVLSWHLGLDKLRL